MIEAKKRQKELTSLSSYLSKLIKKKFGKGPEACFCTIHDNLFIVHVKNFKTPAEEVLLEKDEKKLAASFRSVIMEAILGQFLEEVAAVLGASYQRFFHDWNYENNNGAILLLQNQMPGRINDFSLDQQFQPFLIEKVRHVYYELRKVPAEITIQNVNQHICVIECTGLMPPSEQLLYEKGYADILNAMSLEMKQQFYRHEKHFQMVFNREIRDIFLMEDYVKDKNYITIFLQ
ncbi:Uncharacterized protein YbcI [Evansella caseinilytica]|uniref:Uncharacterized protein YbcI n=1 Tax=Evansella caseinilytica TaxID=1503961 RepID=A0A1H3RC09_9BACI|nr:Na-translocating system protein MpsC family protein [Evansella caseinilytica]SDZ23063.1 Uncharacterized protein YbcI [Evansella caseinilytica]